jgi:hypothetical protein
LKDSAKVGDIEFSVQEEECQLGEVDEIYQTMNVNQNVGNRLEKNWKFVNGRNFLRVEPNSNGSGDVDEAKWELSSIMIALNVFL